jgi:Armadillo-like helical domain-containing protein 3, C-terminal
MTTLLSVCKHYQALLSEHQKASKSRHLSSDEVTKVIKQGYDSIQIPPPSPQVLSTEALSARYKELEYRPILKKIWRVCIADGTILVDRPDNGD